MANQVCSLPAAGNIIAMEFLKENTVFRLESPFIAMARDGFLSAKINLKLSLRCIDRAQVLMTAAVHSLHSGQEGQPGQNQGLLGCFGGLEFAELATSVLPRHVQARSQKRRQLLREGQMSVRGSGLVRLKAHRRVQRTAEERS